MMEDVDPVYASAHRWPRGHEAPHSTMAELLVRLGTFCYWWSWRSGLLELG